MKPATKLYPNPPTNFLKRENAKKQINVDILLWVFPTNNSNNSPIKTIQPPLKINQV